MISKNTKILVAVSVLFFTGSLIVCGIFIQRVSAQKVQYTEKNIERLEMIERENAFDTMNATLEETVREREVLTQTVLAHDGLIQFLAFIEELSREQGVLLTTSSLSEISINETFQDLVIDARVEGSYASVMHVMKLFEHLPYQINLHTVSLERQLVSTNQWIGSFEIHVTQFKKI